MSDDLCQSVLISRAQTLIEPWMIIASFAGFLPQYVAFKRSGTLGVPSGWMLSFVLFSTTQLVVQLLNPAIMVTVKCVQTGKLRGAPAFGALLGIVQVFAQWAFSLGLLFVYLIYRTHTTSEETNAILSTLPGTSPSTPQPPNLLIMHRKLAISSTSSTRLLRIAVTYAGVTLTASLLILLIPIPEDLGSEIIADITYHLFYWIAITLNVISVFFVSFLQFRDILLARNGQQGDIQGLSTWFLRLQFVNLLAVGLLQFTRPGNPVSFWHRYNKLEWFIECGSVPFLYFVLAGVFAGSAGLREIRLRYRSE